MRASTSDLPSRAPITPRCARPRQISHRAHESHHDARVHVRSPTARTNENVARASTSDLPPTPPRVAPTGDLWRGREISRVDESKRSTRPPRRAPPRDARATPARVSAPRALWAPATGATTTSRARMALGADARGDGRARGTTDDVERNPARGRGDGGASSARGAYAAAMEALARWDFGMGWERAAARFRGVADAAREARDAHLECEATLIAAEIEANSVRRLFSVTEAAVARSSVDAAAFERMTRLPLRLALELGDAISETRAHLVVGDYHALVGNSLLANVEAAMEHYGFARELARSAKLLPLEIEAFRRMRWTMSMKGDIDAAVTLSREILRLARAYEIKRKRGERRARKLKENWYSENWYFGGHENQELYALKELACALRGERCMLSRPKTLSKYQDDAVKTFKDAIETLEEHWGEVKQSFETDPQGAVLMLSLLAHLGDIYDNDLDHTQANHEAAVGYRTKYEALGKNVLGPHVTCKLCDKPVGGLSVEDARVRMTHAWDASHFEHHFHSKCYDGFFEKSNTLACPCSFSSP